MGAISASLGQMLSNNQQVNANTTPLQIFFHSIWSNQLIGLARCQLYFPQTLDLASALGEGGRGDFIFLHFKEQQDSFLKF